MPIIDTNIINNNSLLQNLNSAITEKNKFRGVIWGGLGGRRPQGKRKKGKKKEKKKKEKKRRKKKQKKKGTMNNVKLLHIKCCFFQFFNSPVALRNLKKF